MRTTIDLPDELLRRAKAAAAIRGVKLKDFVAALLERGLANEGENTEPAMGQQRPVPVRIQPAERKLKALTNQEIESLFLTEDVERVGFRRSA